MATMEPSPEQFAEWLRLGFNVYSATFPDGDGPPIGVIAPEVARLAYAAGAEAELDACCEWILRDMPRIDEQHSLIKRLKRARRPKPPSLKRQALRDLDGMVEAMRITWGFEPGYPTTIRQALESLPDD